MGMAPKTCRLILHRTWLVAACSVVETAVVAMSWLGWVVGNLLACEELIFFWALPGLMFFVVTVPALDQLFQ
uniref:Uncharacterized protein n=1 Tax=Romanomermis culicivorax TaxID=13658 RepID=A0A915KLU1_ROMCU